MPDDVQRVLREVGLGDGHVVTLKDLPGENASWLVRRASHDPVVLRRYNPSATPADVAYEHTVLRFLSARGWTVPEPLDPLCPLAEIGGGLYCVTRYVPGAARRPETPADQAQRGRDLARLDLALRPLAPDLGQRPGWRPQHTGVTVHEEVDWPRGLDGLRAVDAPLADRAGAAAVATAARLASLGAAALPVTLIHGDFTEWNVHYDAGSGRLAGVIDFGLAHLDSRPYELAIARTYRAPTMIAAYRAELATLGWSLTPLEEATIPALHHAFRVNMVAWLLHTGLRTGRYDLPAITRHLDRAIADE